MRHAIACVLALTLGCTAPDVDLFSDAGKAHGCAVGPGLVATVEHVARGRVVWAPRYRNVQAVETVEQWRRGDGPDRVVLLRVKSNAGDLPGAARVRRIVRGDSGRPVYDEDGFVLGLVSRLTFEGDALIVPLWGALDQGQE